MKYLTGIINTPPICDICGEKMEAEVHSCETNLRGTALTQQIGWSCKKCYDPYDLDRI